MKAPNVPPVMPQQPATDNRQSDPPQQQLLGILAQLEAFLDVVMIKKAPFQIPKNIKVRIATVAPYLVIIGIALLALTLALTILGLLGVMGVKRLALSYVWIESLAAAAVALVLEAMALPGLFKRTAGSWRLIFYASVVSLAGSLLSFNVGAAVGAIVWAVIEWYLLFQVKELYRN
jgi:hypothetical protein